MLDDRRTDRRHDLRRAADGYIKGLKTRTFETIPFHPDITLRAPIVPGGAHNPIHGIDEVLRVWWTPLQPLLVDVEVVIHDYYYNDALNGVVLESDITLTSLPQPATLRLADRFIIDDDGLIVDQENHFDPRDLTNPGKVS
jgi:hypothetical protein